MHESHCDGGKEWISPVDRVGKTWEGKWEWEQQGSGGGGEGEYWDRHLDSGASLE